MQLIDEVASAIRRVADQAIVPRFRALERSAITEKAPGDWVTDADHESEELLTKALLELDPGVAVVGEEAAAADESILAGAHAHDRAWVLDPLDGTRSFIDGSPDFATMVALTEDGLTTAAWIWHPIHQRMYTAVRGGGAFVDGVQLPQPDPPATDRAGWRGVLRTRLMTPDLRAAAMDGFAAEGLEHTPVSAAGMVYPMAATGELTHALYWRTLPWDHAPGTLLAEEVGLTVARLDGSPYRPWDGRFGVLTAANETVWDGVRAALPRSIDDTGE